MRKHYLCIIVILVALCTLLLIGSSALAGDALGKRDLFRGNGNTGYKITKMGSCSELPSYKSSIGKATISGKYSQQKDSKYYSVYGIDGTIEICYEYSGNYQNNGGYGWFLADDGETSVDGIGLPLFKGIGKGTIIVQKSTDGINWVNAVDMKTNYLGKNKSGKDSVILTISEKDVLDGMYYRMYVAYRLDRKTKDGFWFFDEYEKKEYVERYQFYVAANTAAFCVSDLKTGKRLSSSSTVQGGFAVKRLSSSGSIKVNGVTYQGKYLCYYDPGTYNVETTSVIGQVSKYSITIDGGLQFVELPVTYYINEKDEGFTTNHKISSPMFGSKPYVTIEAVVTQNGSIKMVESNTETQFGIIDSELSFYVRKNYVTSDLSSNWSIKDCSWGKKSKQTILNVQTGEIDSGALIIQTSTDGRNWKDESRGRYMSGLYTTDFLEERMKDERVYLYSPAGKSVLNGLFVRVIVAYQIYSSKNKQYQNCLEIHTGYFCSNDLDAIVFHNKTLDDMEQAFSDQTEANIFHISETLAQNSCTTSGFTIDNTGNPTVSCTLTKNGSSVPLKNVKNAVFDETGRYTVTLKSKLGDTRVITIYVDKDTNEEAIQRYFGDGLIQGKRVYSEGDYPVYEAGETYFYLAEVSGKFLPLTGYITNETTGEVISIQALRSERRKVLKTPGRYSAVLANKSGYFNGNYVGDARVFTFRFELIEQGTAPGPVVNKRNLETYAQSSMTDSNPLYYGLTYQSAGKGYITLAFATREAAVNYAYTYEKGNVEKIDDGTFRYGGSIIIEGKKEIYDSTWDLTDAIRYYANAAVTVEYFNIADQQSYVTLSKETIDTENLRTLELQNSVTLFANEEERKQLTATGALPFVNDKPKAVLNVQTGEIDDRSDSYQFVTDDYGGIDSKTVVVKDSKGQQYSLKYGESVGQQLDKLNCASGIISITETTCYGDSTTYSAVYIAPGVNDTTVELECVNNGVISIMAISKENTESFTVDEFKITSIQDNLDSYPLVIVRCKQKEWSMTSGSSLDTVWNEPGEYTVIVTNRLGNGYKLQITVTGSGTTTQLGATQNVEDEDKNTTTTHVTAGVTSSEVVEGEIRTNQEKSTVPVLTIALIIAGSFVSGVLFTILCVSRAKRGKK